MTSKVIEIGEKIRARNPYKTPGKETMSVRMPDGTFETYKVSLEDRFKILKELIQRKS